MEEYRNLFKSYVNFFHLLEYGCMYTVNFRNNNTLYITLVKHEILITFIKYTPENIS